MDGISPNLLGYITGTSLRADLDFGNLDLIFKVIGGLRWQFLVPIISHEPIDGISPNLHEYITGTSLRADQILVTLTSFSRS